MPLFDDSASTLRRKRIHLPFLDKALALAKKSQSRNYKVGCVIADGNFIIGMGKNFIPHDIRRRYHRTRSVHAENDAIRKRRRKDLRGTVCYTVVLSVRGREVVSRPCVICEQVLRSLGVSYFVYSNRGKIEVEKL